MAMRLHITTKEGRHIAKGLVVDVVGALGFVVVCTDVYVSYHARHISTRSVVGYTPLLESHTYVCSPRLTRLPPSCNSNCSSFFKPQRCWLHSATRVTYSCMLPEISSLAA